MDTLTIISTVTSYDMHIHATGCKHIEAEKKAVSAAYADPLVVDEVIDWDDLASYVGAFDVASDACDPEDDPEGYACEVRLAVLTRDIAPCAQGIVELWSLDGVPA